MTVVNCYMTNIIETMILLQGIFLNITNNDFLTKNVEEGEYT